MGWCSGKCPLLTQSGHVGTLVRVRRPPDRVSPASNVRCGQSVLENLAMDALINVVLPVFGIIVTGYLAGRFEALGPDSAAALNRFVLLRTAHSPFRNHGPCAH